MTMEKGIRQATLIPHRGRYESRAVRDVPILAVKKVRFTDEMVVGVFDVW